MIKVLEEDLIVWIDCEMTGLDLGKDHIVEIACIVTDKDLKILDEAPDIVINYPEEVIKSMNEWSWEHHSQSGLVDAIRESKVSLEEADTIISEFIGKHFPKKGSAILAGNSVHVDKKFLEKDFPKTFEYFHYRIIDVSTIKELTRRWYPDVFAKLPTFQNLHRALDDIKGSINELNYYRDMIFKHKINPLATEFVPNTEKNTSPITDSKENTNAITATTTKTTDSTTNANTNTNTKININNQYPIKKYKNYYNNNNGNTKKNYHNKKYYNAGLSDPNIITYRQNNTTFFVKADSTNNNNINHNNKSNYHNNANYTNGGHKYNNNYNKSNNSYKNNNFNNNNQHRINSKYINNNNNNKNNNNINNNNNNGSNLNSKQTFNKFAKPFIPKNLNQTPNTTDATVNTTQEVTQTTEVTPTVVAATN